MVRGQKDERREDVARKEDEGRTTRKSTQRRAGREREADGRENKAESRETPKTQGAGQPPNQQHILLQRLTLLGSHINLFDFLCFKRYFPLEMSRGRHTKDIPHLTKWLR